MEYRNFSVDFPERISELDREFRPIALRKDREVSYTLMKLASAFLLPYERVDGQSGARRADIADRQSIRKYLELDKKFHESAYCSDISLWSIFDVGNFQCGPDQWPQQEGRLDLDVHKVLKLVRHAVAHSNLFLGGDSKIERIYLASRREPDVETGNYRVIRCTVEELNCLVDAWITNIRKPGVIPSLVWRELEDAA